MTETAANEASWSLVALDRDKGVYHYLRNQRRGEPLLQESAETYCGALGPDDLAAAEKGFGSVPADLEPCGECAAGMG